ncbi:maleylpyruvate isomerase family mycothiol-dependent enzyme [Kitasatospora sp. NPDC051853]|uniref:maleylpyruvate isomerase family mycothiol-dependent enzyme n=1 Tax=Kitasatospora sp. NPDC051853 TaxID=3364058 RepID=UPI0037912AE2
MTQTLAFPVLLELIEERATAFRAAVAAAPDLDATVPGCPDWTLYDLAQHLGGGERLWSHNVAAGPAGGPSPEGLAAKAEPAPRELDALLAWLAAGTEQLVSTLRELGEDAPCWTWWAEGATPQTAGGVARHRVQESAVHTYDAQSAIGAPQALPERIALDGVEEFLETCVTTTVAWPHQPVIGDFEATEGRVWRLTLDAAGAAAVALAPGEEHAAPTGSVRGTASDLVLMFYGRLPIESVKGDGEQELFHLLKDWDPEA